MTTRLPLMLLVAATPAARVRGLMDVRELPLGVSGMIFTYPDRAGLRRDPFTNERTLLPLDLVLLGRAGDVAAVVPMRTIVETGGRAETYHSPVPYEAALELPRGLVAGLRAGHLGTLLPGGAPDRVLTLLSFSS